jgi:signal peptidase I
MDLGSYVFLLIIASPFLILCVAGTWKLFQKAGEKGWKALIPYYSSYIMLKISGRPGWWLIWLVVPVASWIVSVGIVIDFIKCYGKFSIRDRAAAVLLPFIYLPKWGFEAKTVYLGRSASPAFATEFPKIARPHIAVQWGQGVFFAMFTAVFIRAFFVEDFSIPSASMERTLLTGDVVLVSKVNYGARIPMTPFSFPFANNTLPNTNTKAYWGGFELPYLRLPGFACVKRGDVVVFNFPGDTLNDRPVDKKEFYIKRCEGLPGDTVFLLVGSVYVNRRLQPVPIGIKQPDGTRMDQTSMRPPDILTENASRILYLEWLEKQSRQPLHKPSRETNKVFPQHLLPDGGIGNIISKNEWDLNNMGPFIVPKKGWTVPLDSVTLPIYRTTIERYEKNSIQLKNGIIYIDGKPAKRYTFKSNYYWMMGDNRDDSFDSRYWGFVPEDHIVGKALFVWMSWDDGASLLDKIRWDRFLKPIN